MMNRVSQPVSWLKTTVTTSTKSTKVKAEPPVLYPVFLLICEHTSDPFWKEFFKGVARGILPKNFGINENVIFYFKKKNSNKSISQIISTDPIEALQSMQTFFRVNGGITSDRDFEIRNTTDQTSISEQVSMEDETWDTIVKNKQKGSYLAAYKERLSREYNLNMKERQSLTNMINYLNAVNLLTSSIVSFDRGRIVNIGDLTFDMSSRTFRTSLTKNIRLTKKSTGKKGVVQKNYLEKEWSRYLSMYRSMKTVRTCGSIKL